MYIASIRAHPFTLGSILRRPLSRNYQVKPLIMRCPPNEFRLKFVKSFLVIGFLLPLHVLQAQDVTPENCSAGLTEARNQLFLGDFDQAISLLQPCIEANAYENTEDLVQAYELLANVYIAINDESQARDAITRLLEADPTYEPDPDQSRSDYVLLINEMRNQLTPGAPSITSIDNELYITNRINWNYIDTPPVADFVLYRGTHPDSLISYASLSVSDLSLSTEPDSSTSTFYVDDNIVSGTTYFYALQAVGANNYTSSRSEIVDVLARDRPLGTATNDPGTVKRKRLSPWIFVGGGVVAGGLAAILAGGGGGGDDPGGNGGEPGVLGGPPPLPTQ